MTKTEQENGFVAPFYKCNAIFTPTQRYLWNKDQVSIESDWNKKEYCWNVIYIGLT